MSEEDFYNSEYSITQQEYNNFVDEIQNGSIERIQEIALEFLNRVSIIGDKPYDPEFGDYKQCICGHPYHRHFDSYENMLPVGCKYCRCGHDEGTGFEENLS